MTSAESGHSIDSLHPLRRALDTALAQIEELMGEPFGTTPHLTIEDDPDFWALAELRGEELHLVISQGVVGRLEALWERALESGALVTIEDGQEMQPAVSELVHGSLVWLILHELQHYDLGHFEVAGTQYLAEAPKAHRYALVSRAPLQTSEPSRRAPPRPDSTLPLAQQLELEADADAIELFLDAPSPDPETWEELRYRAACVGAALILIDREERKVEASGPLHPCAQARIAQMLAILTYVLDRARLSNEDGSGPRLSEEPNVTKDLLLILNCVDTGNAR